MAHGRPLGESTNVDYEFPVTRFYLQQTEDSDDDYEGSLLQERPIVTYFHLWSYTQQIKLYVEHGAMVVNFEDVHELFDPNTRRKIDKRAIPINEEVNGYIFNNDGIVLTLKNGKKLHLKCTDTQQLNDLKNEFHQFNPPQPSVITGNIYTCQFT